MMTPNDIARFWAKVDRSGECWTWTASRKAFGYGRFMLNGRQWTAPRVSWTITHGQIPTGRHILHRCDNPPCVRPDHLLLGDNTDNSADKVTKGRQAFNHGSKSGMSKLDEVKVIAIRDRYAAGSATIPQLAADYGVSVGLVGQIITGRIWKHVGGSVRKGYASGERTNKNKLIEAQVREIRRRYIPGMRMQEIADEYGVSLATIYHIVHRNTWKHLQD